MTVVALAAACAPVAAPPPVAAPAAGPAPVHATLQLCPSASSYSVGAIAENGTILAYKPWIETPAGRLLRNPTDGACLSSGFASRPPSLGGGGRWHSGVDLSNRSGGAIYAAGAGTVVTADWRGSYGLMVEIDHGAGVRTRYAHLSEVDLAIGVGSVVGPGWPIGRMGQTGNATGVHLHYELLIGGRAVDPLFYGR
jgi:murein DD-endopeptidase MepM/ murein hydrolase activator NlpD